MLLLFSTLPILPTQLLFFFNDTATTEIYTLSLHDALPISAPPASRRTGPGPRRPAAPAPSGRHPGRSEEHTSELQSQSNLVCRLLLEKKKSTAHTSHPGRACDAPCDRTVLHGLSGRGQRRR